MYVKRHEKLFDIIAIGPRNYASCTISQKVVDRPGWNFQRKGLSWQHTWSKERFTWVNRTRLNGAVPQCPN